MPIRRWPQSVTLALRFVPIGSGALRVGWSGAVRARLGLDRYIRQISILAGIASIFR